VKTEGKTALVTGANRGLGLETSRELAERGFVVILTGRSAADAASAAHALGNGSGRVAGRELDVSSDASVARLAAELGAEGVRIDVLVNNAGVALDGFDADVARRTLEVNYRGVRRVTDALLPLVVDGGSIVNVSSGMGELSALPVSLRRRFADPALDRDGIDALVESFLCAVAEGSHVEQGWPSNAYRVSKVALNAFTRIVADELAPRAIRVNAVCPGWVKTRMGGQAASRSVREGASGIVWAATRGGDGPNGGFFRDGRPIAW
jgi:NAD(P)-dependent dehydrogenase (short-subunit alcohol dehydrogenase family)